MRNETQHATRRLLGFAVLIPAYIYLLIEVLYRIEYSPDAEGHFRWLTARQRTVALDAVDGQLTHQPMVETRNRKPMRPNPVAPWELRIGELRVYYDIEHEPEQVVYVRAVGVKEGNRVRIAGEVIEL